MIRPRRYASPKATLAALGSRINKAAEDRDADPNIVRRQLVLQCFLSRFYQNETHEWVLKGGTGLLQRFPSSRYSRDIDMSAPPPNEVFECVPVLESVCGPSDNDPLTFRLIKWKPLFGVTGIKATVDVYLEKKFFDSFTLDIAFTSNQEAYDLVVALPIVPFADVQPFPAFRIYPLVNQVADKLYGMYARHERVGQTPIASSRYRDLVDLAFIFTQTEIDLLRLTELLASRIEHDGPLPHAMISPGERWEKGFAAEASGSNLPKELRHLTGALDFVGERLNPVLAAVASQPSQLQL